MSLSQNVQEKDLIPTTRAFPYRDCSEGGDFAGLDQKHNKEENKK